MSNQKLVLGIVIGSLFAACFSATKPLESTQTGNPPVIHTERVALHVTSKGARVIGEPGAVKPGGVTVEVTNITTGVTTTTQAAADGSFEVKVGSGGDSYSVRAKAGGENSKPVYVIRGTAAVGDGRDGSLSCEQLNFLAGELLTQVSESADRSCKKDSDCAPVVARASCYQPSCRFAYVSDRGRAEIERVSGNIDADLCADYETDGCSHPLPKCAEPPAPVCTMGRCGPTVPDHAAASCESLGVDAAARLEEAFKAADKACNDVGDCFVSGISVSCSDACPLYTPVSQVGLDAVRAAVSDIEARECAAFELNGCGVSERDCGGAHVTVNCINNLCKVHEPGDVPPPCGICLDQAVEWGLDSGGGVALRSRVEPCARYRRISTPDLDETLCDTQLDQCGEVSSLGAMWSALQHPDLRALESRNVNPIQFGDTRGEVFRIRIGIRELVLGGACDGTTPDCNPAPAGVEALRKLLQAIDQSLVTRGRCAAIEG